MKPLQTGDYVLATKYRDGDPGDHFVVGFYAGITTRAGGEERFMVVDGNGRPFRANGFRRVARITQQRGAFIVANMRQIEMGTRSVWWWRRCSMNPRPAREGEEDMTDLKPCPFCGEQCDDSAIHGDTFVATCPSCITEDGWVLIDDWNRRAPDRAALVEVARRAFKKAGITNESRIEQVVHEYLAEQEKP